MIKNPKFGSQKSTLFTFALPVKTQFPSGLLVYFYVWSPPCGLVSIHLKCENEFPLSLSCPNLPRCLTTEIDVCVLPVVLLSSVIISG